MRKETEKKVRSGKETRGEKTGKTDRPVRAGQAGTFGKPGKSYKSVKSVRADSSRKPGKSDKSVKPVRVDSSRKPGQADKSVKPVRAGRPEKPGQAERSEILCPVFSHCGGCQYLDVPYEQQLKQKQARLQSLLSKYGKVYPFTGMDDPFHYRNKVHAVFGYQKGQPVSGVYQENSHRLVPVESCKIEDEKADVIIGTIRGMLKSFKIRTYDEDTGYGLLRHVLVRRGFVTGQIMVVLVTASPVFPSKNNFVRALLQAHPEITTVVQNINGRGTSMVLGEREQVLFGKGYIEDELCGLRFRISSRSFYQVNSVQAEKLYGKAIELAGLTGKETVLDAYCGVGTIGLTAAGKAGHVIGVELNPDAVRDAVQNARRNQITNTRFYCNDATRFMEQMAADGATVDVVLMDPPRSGSTPEFIHAVKAVGAKRVVYISCSPDTLARDLEIFRKQGYQAEGVWGYDMFPETEHIECVVLMSKY